MILHLAIRADWEAAKSSGHYTWSTRGITVADEGYTHCSFESQWKGVRDRFYGDLTDQELVLLEINEEKLTNKVVVEQLGAAPEAFPHIYGCIDIAAVVNERALS
jgi:glutathione S-transferase